MNKKKIEELLKDSAKDIQVPDSLKPDMVLKRLKEENGKTKQKSEGEWNGEDEDKRDGEVIVPFRKRISVRKVGTAAAAVVVLVAAAAVWKIPMAVKQPSEKNRTEAEQEYTGRIRMPDSYEQLYDLLEKNKSSFEDTGVFYKGLAQEDAVMISEEADESSGEDIAATGDYSLTNAQEENVDEADIVKTDGKYLYAMDSRGDIRIVDAEKMEVASVISFPGEEDDTPYEMYLDGDILQIVWGHFEYKMMEDTIESEGNETRLHYAKEMYSTAVTTFDISDRSNPEQAGYFQQEGFYQTSRKQGEYLYLFTDFQPDIQYGEDVWDTYIPKAGEDFLECTDIFIPEKTEGAAGYRYKIMASVANDNPSEAEDRAAVLGSGNLFYVSEKNIYAVMRYGYQDEQGEEDYTELFRLAYADGSFGECAIGRVPGSLNDNFSMNEYKDNLRVVTTVTDYADGFKCTNGLYILDKDMAIIGKIEGLAEEETIKSARFMGDTGYFVTYRETDPLFSVDLSDPEKPEVKGKLKITGFSQYLHIYGEDRLLGIGWETDPETGWEEGLKCSMFDTSDISSVKECDRMILENVLECYGLYNYKAFLVDAQKNIFGFVYRNGGEQGNYENSEYFYGVYSYDENGFRLEKAICLTGDFADEYEDAEAVRGVYIGNMFYLTGNNGINAYDMAQDFVQTDTLRW
ncbi:MAG: beta-propeller domain-containing protein [Blautia sp.]|nr:beta-propeller domain-containing protein [Blautia sp.]